MRNKMISRSLLISGLVCVFVIGGWAQHASIKTATGYLHVYNGKPHSFTLEVSGKTVEAKQAAGNPAFSIDGNLVQVLMIPRGNFDPDRKANSKDLLDAHKRWELEYLINEIFKSDIKAETETIKLGDKTALFWSFVRPKYTVEFDRDSFLTTSFGDGIVGLSSPVKIAEPLISSRERLVKILSTLKVSEKPFDISKLADEIRRGVRQN